MQTLLKQSIIGGLSFLLLTGIAFSVGSSEPSVFEGEASVAYSTGFEDVTKAGYASATISTGPTGNKKTWTLDNSLIGTDASDKKNDTKSVRLRNEASSILRLDGLISNVSTITYYDGLYGTDTGGKYKIQITKQSTDTDWIDLGSENTPTSTFTQRTITLNYPLTSGSVTIQSTDPIRIKFFKTVSNARINIDDVVFNSPIAVTSISVSPETATIQGVGNTQQLTATISPANATNQSINWTSSDTEIATVSSSGLVTAVAVGSATITATTVDGSFTDTSAITVQSVTQVTSISVGLGSATISSGATTQATETVLPAEATVKTVTWTSSNISIATVNSSGLVTANSSGLAGTSVIRATATDGSGVFGEATVTVSSVNVTSVSVSPETATIVGLGSTQQLTATISPNNATNKNITWTSSDEAVATVNSSGLVTSVSGGVATITATTEDGSFTDTATITVSYVAVTGLTLSSNEVTLYTAGTFRTTTLIATIAPENASNKTVTWSSSNAAVASVNSSGLVTGLTVGSATITATSNDNNAFTATASIIVLARTIANVTIKTNPSKTTFALGENLYSPSMVLTVSYNDSTSEDVSSGYSLTGYNSKQLGTQTITVTYPGYAGTNPTYNVFVSNVGSATPTVATDLFISEYVEGSGNNKAIEIFNGTGAGVSLLNYKLRVHANGATSTTDITLGATTLANNATFVIANGSANASILAIANSTTGSINFNGDDAVSLYKVSTATNIDVIGTIGTDPGDAFTGQAANGDGTTLDKTITRTPNIDQPSSTFKFQEWSVLAADTFSNLGSHTFTPLTSTEQSQAFADYLEQFTTCSLTGPDSISTLVSEYNAMTAASKTAFASITIDDYDNDAYLTNGSSYTGLTRTASVNALNKLNKIISLYNSQNPGNTVVLNARVPNRTTVEDNQSMFMMFITIPSLFALIWFFKRRRYSN